jgi:hypothetical protein
MACIPSRLIRYFRAVFAVVRGVSGSKSELLRIWVFEGFRVKG